MSRWRMNVYRVPPRDETTEPSSPRSAREDRNEDEQEVSAWRFADAVYDDVM